MSINKELCVVIRMILRTQTTNKDNFSGTIYEISYVFFVIRKHFSHHVHLFFEFEQQKKLLQKLNVRLHALNFILYVNTLHEYRISVSRYHHSMASF
jgi:hypothetical protein